VRNNEEEEKQEDHQKNEEKNKKKGNEGSIPASCRKQLSSEALNKKKNPAHPRKKVKKQGVPKKNI
jgi:hypothetical protein